MTKQFHAAARRGTSKVKNPIPVDFEYEIGDDEYVTMTAQPPTSGQVSLFAIHQMEGGVVAVKAIFDLLMQILPGEDWALIEADLEDGLDVTILNEIVEHCLEVWGGNPTSSSSASSRSRPNTGKRSTATRASKATRSTSRSTASST
jgi:hypothetical protein